MMRRRRSAGIRAAYQDRVVQFLVLLMLLGLVGFGAIHFDRSLVWIALTAACAAATIVVAGNRKVRRPAKRTAREAPWVFPAIVATLMAACFSTAFFWSDLRPAFATATQRLTTKSLETAFQLSRPGAAGSRRLSFTCEVSDVHDGDTLRCADGARVRLHAVAARELDGTCSPGHPCPAASAESARAALQQLAARQTIQCSPIGRSYGRVTAICRTNTGLEINCAMVRSGTTLVWERFNRQAQICQGS